MPIKPENKKLYPKNWKAIRARILKRADNNCEMCGLPNYSIGYRNPNNKEDFIHTPKCAWKSEFPLPGLDMFGFSVHIVRVIKIVLTIAHMDHNVLNGHDINLMALCQRCHNVHDMPHRVETRKITCLNRRIKKKGEPLPLNITNKHRIKGT